MIKKWRPPTVFVVIAASVFATPVFAHGKSTFETTLVGIQRNTVDPESHRVAGVSSPRSARTNRRSRTR